MATFAAILRQRKDYKPGTPIRLMCYDTGKGNDCFAQRLSNEMGVEVIAPTAKLYIYTDGSGRFYVGRTGKGEMKTFIPKDG